MFLDAARKNGEADAHTHRHALPKTDGLAAVGFDAARTVLTEPTPALAGPATLPPSR